MPECHSLLMSYSQGKQFLLLHSFTGVNDICQVKCSLVGFCEKSTQYFSLVYLMVMVSLSLTGSKRETDV